MTPNEKNYGAEVLKKKVKPKKFYSEKRFNEILRDLNSKDVATKQNARLLITDYLPLTTSIANTAFFRNRALRVINLLVKFNKLEAVIRKAGKEKQERKNPRKKGKKTGKRETKTQKAIVKLKLALSSSNRFLRAQKGFSKLLRKMERYDIEDDENILEQVDVNMAARIEMNDFAQWRAKENERWPKPVFSGRAEYFECSKIEKTNESVLSGTATSEVNLNSAGNMGNKSTML